MKRLRVMFALTILAFGALDASAAAVEPSLETVVRKIQTAYDTTSDWKTEFNQVTWIEGFDSPIRSEGSLYIKKPGKLRWDYRKPNRHQIMVNAERIWIYTPEHNQVIVSSSTEVSDSRLPLHFLTGVGRLNQDFTVQWTDPDQPWENDAPSLTLIPRGSGTGLSRLLVKVDPVRYFITELTLFQLNGNHSVFRFSHIRDNTGIKDSFFVFAAPEGVVVVESPRMNP